MLAPLNHADNDRVFTIGILRRIARRLPKRAPATCHRSTGSARNLHSAEKPCNIRL